MDVSPDCTDTAAVYIYRFYMPQELDRIALLPCQSPQAELVARYRLE